MDFGEILAEGKIGTATVAPLWFTADPSLAVITALRSYVMQSQTAMKNTAGISADPDEDTAVLTSAKAIGATWD